MYSVHTQDATFSIIIILYFIGIYIFLDLLRQTNIILIYPYNYSKKSFLSLAIIIITIIFTDFFIKQIHWM